MELIQIDTKEIDGVPMMSSKQIAELLEKRPDTVKVSIERLQEQELISFTPMTENPEVQGGRPSTTYYVNEHDSYIVVARLSPKFTADLVDGWYALKKKALELATENFNLSKRLDSMESLLLDIQGKQLVAPQVEDSLEKIIASLPPDVKALLPNIPEGQTRRNVKGRDVKLVKRLNELGYSFEDIKDIAKFCDQVVKEILAGKRDALLLDGSFARQVNSYPIEVVDTVEQKEKLEALGALAFTSSLARRGKGEAQRETFTGC